VGRGRFRRSGETGQAFLGLILAREPIGLACFGIFALNFPDSIYRKSELSDTAAIPDNSKAYNVLIVFSSLGKSS
jgi:hypothetical protein